LAVAPVPWFGHSTRRMLLLLWVLAFSHGLFLQLGSVDRSWPFPVFYEGDAETFHRFALSILAGQPYDGGIPFHPPLYPFFLAACHALLGNPATGLVLRMAHGAVYALSVPVLWLWLRRHLTAGAALAGAFLAAWSFGLALISTAAVSEGLYLLLLLGGLLAFDRVREAERGRGAPQRSVGETAPPPIARDGHLAMRRAVLLGLLGGLLALTRAEGLGWSLLLTAGGAAAAWRHARRSSRGAAKVPTGITPGAAGETTIAAAPDAAFAGRRAVLPWAVALAALCATLAPWTIRNAVVLTRVNALGNAVGLTPLPTFVVTTAYGPLNFALGNYAGAPGYFTRGALTSGRDRDLLDLTDPQHRDLFLHGYRRGWDWMRSHPDDFLALAGRKLALLSRAVRLGWTQWDLPGGLQGTRFPVDLLTPDASPAVVVHLALLLPGAWLLLAGKAGQNRARGRSLLVITGGYILFAMAVTLAFFGYARQGVPALALLCGVEGTALAAGGGWLLRRVEGRVRRRRSAGGNADAGDAGGAGGSSASGGRVTGPRLVAGIIVLVWTVELVGAFSARDFLATGETQVDSKMLNRDSIMYLSPKSR
jgi:hypothetical protein